MILESWASRFAKRGDLAAAGLRRCGLEPRHLRQWRTTVDREMALIEQLAPQLRDRTSTAALGEAKKDLLNMRDRILHPP